MRTDAKKNLKKVATEVLKDPLATEREIAKKCGLSLGNVHDKLSKLDHIDRTSTVVCIAESDLEIVFQSQGLTQRWLNDMQNADKVGREDINTAVRAGEVSQKRYSLLAGENVKPDGGEKAIPYLPYKESNVVETTSETG